MIDVIASAVELLARHPQIGRRVEYYMRELVISHGKTGYVALYDFDPDQDVVVILAIRHQREAGYEDECPPQMGLTALVPRGFSRDPCQRGTGYENEWVLGKSVLTPLVPNLRRYLGNRWGPVACEYRNHSPHRDRMKRKLPIIIGLAAIAIGLMMWRWRGHESTTESTGGVTTGKAAARAVTKRVDPRTLQRGLISGNVRDENKLPVAGATVCADIEDEELPSALTRQPACATTDAVGGYALRDLLATNYRVVASAVRRRVERTDKMTLAAGQSMANVDFMLHPGGVEITGTVADIGGGPIAHARVRVLDSYRLATGPVVETDLNGTFSAWVAPGFANVTVAADGYASETEYTHAPSALAFSLTPESSLAGTVVDARTGAPIDDAHVTLTPTEWRWNGEHTARTGVAGTFRFVGLHPSRYELTARIARGHGRSAGSTLVGLGQSVDAVVIKVFPAAQIIGRVMIAGSVPHVCVESTVELRDEATGVELRALTAPDGTVVADGVPPGTYFPSVWCQDRRAREPYPGIPVVASDVVDQSWPVDTAFAVRGRVLSARSEPIADARISATSGPFTLSAHDGTFDLRGVTTGAQKLTVESSHGFAPPDGFEIVVTGDLEHQDLVLADGGVIEGSVVYADGSPVAGVMAVVQLDHSRGEATTDTSGAFRITGLRPGDYRVTARRGGHDDLPKAGAGRRSTVDELTTVRVEQTSRVRLVVATHDAEIRGLVVDGAGKPVADAFVTRARETYGEQMSWRTRESWQDERDPLLTASDGSFTIRKLLPGKYTVRAFRRGGGEAIAEHVATGTTQRLTIQQPGSIEGVVTNASGGFPENLMIGIEDLKSGLERRESFFRTDGAFVLRDLPSGRIRLTASANGGRKITDVELAAGERKAGVVIELDGFVTLTGRVVDAFTREPVPGVQMTATPVPQSTIAWSLGLGPDRSGSTTDEDGRFSLRSTPRGRVSLNGQHLSWEYGAIVAERTLSGVGVVDVGDIIAIKRRRKDDDTYAYLGIEFAPLPNGRYSPEYMFEVRAIDPRGPSAATDLRVGDVVISIDGIDIGGSNYWYAETLMDASVGTKLMLGLARGVSVPVILGAAPK